MEENTNVKKTVSLDCKCGHITNQEDDEILMCENCYRIFINPNNNKIFKEKE